MVKCIFGIYIQRCVSKYFENYDRIFMIHNLEKAIWIHDLTTILYMHQRCWSYKELS